MKLVTYDVEHGNCHVLWLPNEQKDAMMFDAGSKSNFSPSLHLKSKWGVDRLRWLHITHQDSDHLTDIENVGKINPVTLTRPVVTREYLENHHGTPLPDTIENFLEFEKSFSAEALPVEHSSHDWGGVRFARFFNKMEDFSNINNISLTTFVNFKGWTFLLPGDLEKEGWLKLLEINEFREWLAKVDVFVASHHGRENGYCQEVFQYSSPLITIVSDKSISDTSVTDKYANGSRGLKVRGFEKPRKVLSTRNDGAIYFEITPEGRYRVEVFQT